MPSCFTKKEYQKYIQFCFHEKLVKRFISFDLYIKGPDWNFIHFVCYKVWLPIWISIKYKMTLRVQITWSKSIKALIWTYYDAKLGPKWVKIGYNHFRNFLHSIFAKFFSQKLLLHFAKFRETRHSNDNKASTFLDFIVVCQNCAPQGSKCLATSLIVVDCCSYIFIH